MQVAYNLQRKEEVQYRAKDGSLVDCTIISVQKTFWPPSYLIKERESGNERDTEFSRLVPASLTSQLPNQVVVGNVTNDSEQDQVHVDQVQVCLKRYRLPSCQHAYK